MHPPTRSFLPYLALAACAGGSSTPPALEVARSSKLRATPTVSEADRTAVVDGNAAFALAMYAQIGKEAQNVVFSPLSISMAVAMTWAGARGTTETEMAQAVAEKGTEAAAATAVVVGRKSAPVAHGAPSGNSARSFRRA